MLGILIFIHIQVKQFPVYFLTPKKSLNFHTRLSLNLYLPIKSCKIQKNKIFSVKVLNMTLSLDVCTY